MARDEPSPRRYADRSDAGRALAAWLADYAGRSDVVVLGLPRGGVPVAAQVARALGAPLDVLVVRKVGVPGQPELAMGAIAAVAGTTEVVRNTDVLALAQRLGHEEGVFERVAARERVELDRRERAYRGGRPPVEVMGRAVVVVDDGLATGATMRAAVAVLRRLRPAYVVVAVPVGSDEACAAVAAIADEVVCARSPVGLRGVGDAYRDFTQTDDEEVRRALAAR